MPAKSEKQRRFMAMCHEDPGKKGCPKGMTKGQMHDFMYRAPHNPVKKGTTHGAAKNLGIPKGPKNKGTTRVPYSSKSVASSIMKRMHRPRGG